MLLAHSPVDLFPALNAHDVCATIGNFDGVHIGHRVLIARTRYMAARRNMLNMVVTFWPHPLSVLAGRHTPPQLTTREQRRLLLERLGVNILLELPFTRELAACTPETFLRELLMPMGLAELVIGYDFSLGKGRAGNYDVLKALGERLGFGVEQVPPVIVNGAVVSSTRVRDLLQKGDVWELRPLLGRFHFLSGAIIHGYGRGEGLGFPTANLEVPDVLLPRRGVYAAWADCGDAIRPAVTNIGVNPTFGNDRVSVESFLPDTDINLYNRQINLHFVQRLRDEQRFASVEELKARIARDVDLARRILASPEAALKR